MRCQQESVVVEIDLAINDDLAAIIDSLGITEQYSRITVDEIIQIPQNAITIDKGNARRTAGEVVADDLAQVIDGCGGS